MGLVNPVSNFLEGLVLRAFADWRVTGRENVPPMGPLIIVANHLSNFDPALVSTSIPRTPSFLAKKSLFRHPLVSWFLRSYGAYPLDREASDVRAYRWALRQLDRGEAIVIFPEGTRGHGGMRKAHTGVARMAMKTQATLLPVGITGTENLQSWTRLFVPTGKVGLNIGVPFAIPSIDGRPDGGVLDSVTHMIMQRVAVLLPPQYRGYYGTAVPKDSGAAATSSQGIESGSLPLA